MQLAESARAQSYRLTHHLRVGSTNDEAISIAIAGDMGRHWIIADEQSEGRGRHGRQWASPPGNLYASLLLIDPAPPHKAPELGFVAGVALWHALRGVLGDDPLLAIKWPNDILHGGAKLAGILLESVQLKGGALACVVGMGVNCCSHPETSLYPATDLAEIGTLLSHRDDVFARLADEIAGWLDLWDEGRDFAAIRAEWLRHAAGLGARIAVSTAAEPRSGIFETIDATGRLVLNDGGKTLMIEAGDVFLKNTPLGALAGLRDASAETVSREDRS